MSSQGSDPASDGNYSLRVKDFGPIARADVEFRPLTVFVGPSNTGKSYLAILAYVLHRCFESYGFRARRRRDQHGVPQTIGRVKLNQSERASWAQWIDTLRMVESVPPLPGAVAAGVRRTLERPEGVDWHLAGEMRRVFGVGHGGDLVRRAGTQTTALVGLHIPQGASRPAVQYEFTFGRRTSRLVGHVADESVTFTLEAVPEKILEDLAYFWLRRRTSDADLADHEQQYSVRLLLDALWGLLVRPLAQSAFYLPASRTGVMNTHQALVSAFIRDATRAGLEPARPVGRLAGVVADFLDQVTQMPAARERGPAQHWRELAKLAEGLEQRVLGGAVRQVRSETGYPIFSYRPRDWEKDDLPLMRTSSMVSELAPVVLYLRHLVEPGDVLIIEEPESHLHPETQTALARELARVVHAGVRIILTTHSEWFVEQISNLVRLSEVPTARRAGIRGSGVALGHEEVGVWRFEESKRPKGSVVREVELDDDTGLFPAGYDAVSEALYDESARTFNRLQRSRPK